MKFSKIYQETLLACVNKYCPRDLSISVSSALLDEAEMLSLGVQPTKGQRGVAKVSLLQNINRSQTTDEYVTRPQRLSITRESFAVKRTELGEFEGALQNLWDSFADEFKQLDETDDYYGENILNLLFRYTTNMAANADMPDVSLYDHIKTTAAIAVCLNAESCSLSHPFLIVGGDMSGIQGYIYEIVSKYAGKNLKGRSFYLRLLSDAIVRYLTKQLQLPRANVIYDSGGCFYLLAPNTPQHRQWLQEAIKQIEQKLFRCHGTKLFMAIDCVDVSKETLLHESGFPTLKEVWHELFEKRDMKKQARLATVIEQNYDQFFEPILCGGDAWRDAISGEEALKGEKPYPSKDIAGIEGQVRRITGQQIELGKLLRETDVMVVSQSPLQDVKAEDFNPIELGFHYYFLKADEANHISTPDIACVAFNSIPQGFKHPCSVQFYGGNRWNGNSFEEMCKNEGFARLGVLRMDVDNLGAIFQGGFTDGQATLARYSELSRSLDWFFSGYLNDLQQRKAVDDTFIVYSGGDDVFIIGDWRYTIEMAKQIREEFRNYTCQNPAFSISGGIAIVPAKFPIMKAAEESAEEEDNAKHHQCKDKEKNALSFMDVALNWDKEFGLVEGLKSAIVNRLENDSLNKSFLSKIHSHWSNAGWQNHQITNFKTFWMMAYDVERIKKRSQQESESFLNNCINECCGKNHSLNGIPIDSDYHPLELWAFAARWAELEFRSKQGE